MAPGRMSGLGHCCLPCSMLTFGWAVSRADPWSMYIWPGLHGRPWGVKLLPWLWAAPKTIRKKWQGSVTSPWKL